MIDLKERFRTLDRMRPPDLWPAIRARALETGRRPAPPPHRLITIRRLVPVGAAAVAALIAILVLVVPRPQSASAIVQEAIANAASLPPLRATVSYSFIPGSPVPGTGVYEVSYESRTVWRVNVVERTGNPVGPGNFAEELAFAFPFAGQFSGPGDFIVSDGEREGLYLARRNYFFSRSLELEQSPLGQLTWEDSFVGQQSGVFPTPVAGPAPLTTWKGRCADSQVFSDEQIAGRAARHVRCGDWELWIDAETGLVLRVETSAYILEINEIDYAPAFSSGAFEVALPQGACDRGTGGGLPEDPQTCLSVGKAAPSWTGPLLGEGTFDLSAERGTPVLVLFWSDFYQPGDSPIEALKDFQAAFERWGDRVRFVSIDTGPGVTAEAASDVLRQNGYTFPVVLDAAEMVSLAGGDISTLWGIEGVPAWVALDAEGRVVDMQFGRLTSDQIDELLTKASG